MLCMVLGRGHIFGRQFSFRDSVMEIYIWFGLVLFFSENKKKEKG